MPASPVPEIARHQRRKVSKKPNLDSVFGPPRCDERWMNDLPGVPRGLRGGRFLCRSILEPGNPAARFAQLPWQPRFAQLTWQPRSVGRVAVGFAEGRAENPDALRVFPLLGGVLLLGARKHDVRSALRAWHLASCLSRTHPMHYEWSRFFFRSCRRSFRIPCPSMSLHRNPKKSPKTESRFYFWIFSKFSAAGWLRG